MAKVKAIARGYYGQLREPGDVFDYPGNKKLGSWMEPVGKPAPANPPAGNQPTENPPNGDPTGGNPGGDNSNNNADNLV